MKRKIAWIILAGLLINCGCSSGAGENEILTDSTSDTTTESSEIVEYVLPEADYDGYEFTIAGRENEDGSWAILRKKAYSQEEETGDVVDDALYRRQVEVSEKYGVTLNYFPYNVSDPANVINSLLAGDNAFDLIECNAWYINKFLAYNDLFVDFLSEDVVDLGNPWWEKSAVEEFSINNKLFAITGDAALLHNLSSAVIYFNKQMVENYSLDDPYTLVSEGKWTLDAIYDMSKQVTDDLDGDGEIHIDTDRLGLMGSATSLVYFVRAAGFDLTTKNSADIPELNMYSERSVDIMTKVQTMLRDTEHNYNSALVSPKNKNYSGDVFYNLVLPSFKSGRGLFHFNWLFLAMDLRDMEIDFGMLPMPKYDEAQDEYISVTCDNWDTFEMIPYTDAEGIKRSGIILEALGYYGMEYVTPAAVERTIGGKLTRDDGSLETINIVSASKDYDIASIYNWGGLVAFFSSFANKTNAEFASSYAANESIIKEEMNKTIEALTK